MEHKSVKTLKEPGREDLTAFVRAIEQTADTVTQ